MKKINILIFCLVLLSLTCQSQQTATITKLADSCMLLLNNGNIAASSVVCNKMLSLAEKLPNSAEKGRVYIVAGNISIRKTEFEKAEKCYSKATEIGEIIGNKDGQKLKAKALFCRSEMFIENGDYETTLKLCFQAESIFQKLNETSWLADIHNRIGAMYVILHQKDKALYYNRKAYQEAMQTGDKITMGECMISYANSLAETGDTIGAIRQYNAVAKIGEQMHIASMSTTAFYNIALLHSNKHNYRKALHYFEEAYKWAKINHYAYDICDVLCEIGSTLGHMKAYSQARDTLLIALEMAGEIQSKTLQQNIYKGLKSIEAEVGNYQLAYEYSNLYSDLTLQILSEKGQQQVNALEAKNKATQRDSDISRLTQEKRFQAEQMQKKNIIIITIAALFLLTFFSGSLLIRSYKQKQKLIKQENEIQKHKIRELENERILLATQSVLKGEETERKRLARDLHDGLGGLLSGVKITLNNMKGNVVVANDGVDDFNHALSLLDTSITELRRVAHNMMPEALMKLGLKDTLSDFCAEINKTITLHVIFQFYGQFERLDSNIEINSYRIIQELVNNAIKHSEAKELIVQMIQEPGRLCFMVRDDGKGFDIRNLDPSKGIGLSSVKSRVESFHGTMEIQSAPNNGTEIAIEFSV